jgi:hypothetical protein
LHALLRPFFCSWHFFSLACSWHFFSIVCEYRSWPMCVIVRWCWN